jgi:hypothetical protein
VGDAVSREVHARVVYQDVTQGVPEGVILVAEDECPGGVRSGPAQFERFRSPLDFYLVDGHLCI